MKEKYYASVLIFFTSLLALILLISLAGAGGGIILYSESDANNVSKYRLWDFFDFSEERYAYVIAVRDNDGDSWQSITTITLTSAVVDEECINSSQLIEKLLKDHLKRRVER